MIFKHALSTLQQWLACMQDGTKIVGNARSKSDISWCSYYK